MLIKGRCCLFLLVTLLYAAAVSSQQPAPQTQAVSGGIYLDVVVTPKSGPPVSGLHQRDFTLLDNKAPQAIASFQTIDGRDARVDVILVIDAVNDTVQNVGYERLQIDKFLRADGGNLKYPLALAVFTDKGIEDISNFLTDGNALSAALQKDSVSLRDVGRAAGYWGAAERVQLSLMALGQLVASESSRPERKVVLWVSPGWPLLYSPDSGLDAALQKQTFGDIVRLSAALRQARVTLYSVDPLGAGQPATRATYYRNFLQGVTKPSQTQVADLGVQVLAVQSGGLVLSTSNDIAAMLEQCLADTAPYYEISFAPRPPERPDEYHRLDIRVAKPGLTARTRQGYYSQPRTR